MRRQQEGQGLITRLARAVSLGRAGALTRAQRLARAFFWVCLGASLAMWTAAARDVVIPATLEPGKPVIEVDTEALYIVRFPYQYRGGEVNCYAVVRTEARTWLARC